MRVLIISTFPLLLLINISNSFSQSNQGINIKIDTLFSEWSDINSPGCAVGVIKDGQVLFSKGYGSANLDDKTPINQNTVFHIASLSKQFTASCLAILILQDKISLEDDIRNYIPDFPNLGDTIKIKHLIYHTCGLKDYPEMMGYIGNSLENFNSYSNVFDLLFSQKELVNKPGDIFQYGNHGYTLAVKVIENVSKMSINAFATKHIFDSLGMKNTFYNENTRITIPNKAISYDKSLDGVWQKHYINTPCIGSGNIVTTLSDLLLWEKNFHNNVIFPKGYTNLITKRGILNNGDTLSYAFGVVQGKYRGLTTISHSGSVNCYESRIFRIPDYNISVIILSNVYYIKDILDHNQLAEKMAHIFLQEELGKRKLKVRKTNIINYPSSPVKTNFSGIYKSDKGLTHIFIKQNKYRVVHSFNGWFDSMLPINDSLCVDEYATDDFYKFNLDNDGNIISMNCPYTGLALKTKNRFSASSLNGYKGTYYSEELNSVFKFYQIDQKLFCKVNNNPGVELFYISDKELKLENLIIEPIDKQNGQINSLKISGDMGGNIKIKRLMNENAP